MFAYPSNTEPVHHNSLTLSSLNHYFENSIPVHFHQNHFSIFKMSLKAQLDAHSEAFKQNAPEFAQKAILGARADHAASFDPSTTIQAGQSLPPFSLSNAVGEQVNSADILKKGPVLVVFYRGGWCPFCNLALHGYQQRLAEITAAGVTLVAISPELPNSSLTTVEKHALGFQVLSDVGNKFADKLGIVYHMPDTLRPVFEKFGNNLKERNGDDSMEVPIPTTLLVDREGVVREMFLETDYTKRLEPEVAVEWCKKL